MENRNERQPTARNQLIWTGRITEHMQFCIAFILSICNCNNNCGLLDTRQMSTHQFYYRMDMMDCSVVHVLIRIFMFSCRWRRYMWTISFYFSFKLSFCLLCIFQVEFGSLFCIFRILASSSVFICFENVFICYLFACKGSGHRKNCAFMRIRWYVADLFLW